MRALTLLLSFAVLTGCSDSDPAADVTIETGALVDPRGAAVENEALGADAEATGFSTEASAQAVEGAWRSADDTSVVVTFGPGTFQESYDGEVLTSGSVSFSEGCPGTPSGDLFAFTVDADDDPICYHVVEAAGGRLAYSMAGGRGNTLAFERAE